MEFSDILISKLNFYRSRILSHNDNQGPDFDDMSSFFSCETDDAIQYINLGYVRVYLIRLLSPSFKRLVTRNDRDSNLIR
jgi:hypothetical protein